LLNLKINMHVRKVACLDSSFLNEEEKQKFSEIKN